MSDFGCPVRGCENGAGVVIYRRGVPLVYVCAEHKRVIDAAPSQWKVTFTLNGPTDICPVDA